MVRHPEDPLARIVKSYGTGRTTAPASTVEEALEIIGKLHKISFSNFKTVHHLPTNIQESEKFNTWQL